MVFKQKGDTLFAFLQEELDHHSAERLRNRLDDEVERKKAKNLILTLGDMTFMDSAGIGFLIGRYKKRKEQGGQMLLAGGSKSVCRILEMAGIYTLAAHYETTEEAEAALLSVQGKERKDGQK